MIRTHRRPIVAILATLLAASCGAQHTPADADADSDADADGDADGDADSDADQEEYWPWSRIEADIPQVLRTGTYSDGVKIWAVADDDVVLCNHDVEEEVGGIGRFDGAAFTVETEAILCDDVWATPDGVLLARGVDALTFAPIVSRREGATWVPETIDGADGCSFEAFYATPDGIAMLVAACGTGERRPFTRAGGTWSVSARWVPPSTTLTFLLGAFAWSAEPVFYGRGEAVGDGLVASGATELGYPEGVAFWGAGLSAPVGILALGLRRLLRWDGVAWATVADCPHELPSDSSACWHLGASFGGGVFLGGGAGTGDTGDEDWRVDWWDGATLHRTLAPCGEQPPHCGIDDLSLTEDRIWVAARGDGWSGLMWAPLPD